MRLLLGMYWDSLSVFIGGKRIWGGFMGLVAADGEPLWLLLFVKVKYKVSEEFPGGLLVRTWL